VREASAAAVVGAWLAGTAATLDEAAALEAAAADGGANAASGPAKLSRRSPAEAERRDRGTPRPRMDGANIAHFRFVVGERW
jgi:hypothetical protein